MNIMFKNGVLTTLPSNEIIATDIEEVEIYLMYKTMQVLLGIISKGDSAMCLHYVKDVYISRFKRTAEVYIKVI